MEDRIPYQIEVTAEAMQDADQKYFETVEAKYGKHPATILSECANLLLLIRFFPVMDKCVANLISHVAEAFSIPKKEIIAVLQQFTEIRTISTCPPGKLN